MEIKTRYFGNIEIDETKQLYFASGLPGFTEETAFILLDMPGNTIFQSMQSLRTPELAFIVTNPYHFCEDYTIDLDNSILNQLKIKHKEDVSLLAIVTLQEPFSGSTLNLRAPIVVNVRECCAKQYISETHDYTSKAPIIKQTTEDEEGD